MKSQHQTIYLANGKKRLVPAGAEILNPELMGEAVCAYYVQTFDPMHEKVPRADYGSEAPGTLFIYLTSLPDLHVIGRNTPAEMEASHFRDLLAEYKRLEKLMLSRWECGPYAGKPYGWKFMLVDNFGAQPVGTSPLYATEAMLRG